MPQFLKAALSCFFPQNPIFLNPIFPMGLDRVFFQDQANIMYFGNGTQCLLQSDVDLAKLPKLT